VQDPDDAQVATMPRSAINQFAPHLILPLARIGALLPMLETE
jgi:two-component system chemotaxis response regulator CheB